jgi:integrase
MKTSLYIRVKMSDGKYLTTRPVFNKKGRIRPGYALVDGTPKQFDNAAYVLRYGTTWETVGDDANDALTALERKNHELRSVKLGISVAPSDTIMLDCGMRPEEVGRMEWEHVRWNENAILVPHGKSFKSRRFVGMTEWMRETLTHRKRENERLHRGMTPFVFPTRAKGGHMASFSKLWARTIERCNRVRKLPDDLVLYSARHKFATQFLRNGGDLGTLSRLMGHSNIGTTQKYLHLMEAGATAAIMDKRNMETLRNTMPTKEKCPLTSFGKESRGGKLLRWPTTTG